MPGAYDAALWGLLSRTVELTPSRPGAAGVCDALSGWKKSLSFFFFSYFGLILFFYGYILVKGLASSFFCIVFFSLQSSQPPPRCWTGLGSFLSSPDALLLLWFYRRLASLILKPWKLLLIQHMDKATPGSSIP